MKHFLKLLDCTTEEIYELLDLAATMKQYVKEGKEHHFLKGKTLGMIFEKSSTRTRISFETGMPNRPCGSGYRRWLCWSPFWSWFYRLPR